MEDEDGEQYEVPSTSCAPPPIKRPKLVGDPIHDQIEEQPFEADFFISLPVFTKDGLSPLTIHQTGSHTKIEHTYVLLRADNPIPCGGTAKRKVPVSLPLIAKFVKRRPHLKDTSLRSYLNDAKKKDFETHYLDGGTIDLSNKKLSVYRSLEHGEYIAISHEQRIFCKVCKKPMSFTGRSVNVERSKKFRPCCFMAPKYKKVEGHPFSNYEDVFQITYDIETYNDDYRGGNMPHKFALMCARGINGEERTFTSIRDFFVFVDATVQELQSRWPTQFKQKIQMAVDDEEGKDDVNMGKYLLQLVSFNGSRYDDIFLAQPWKEFLVEKYGTNVFQNLHYSERKRAITHNNIAIGMIDKVYIEFCDVLRFTNPTSLRNAAKSYKLSVLKGEMPFEVFNRFCLKDTIEREEDGFFSLEYFKGNTQLRQESFEYYKQCLPNPQTFGDADVLDFCKIYCKQDVEVTYLLYKHLEGMFSTYLSPLVPSGEGQKFQPMTQHSMATLCYRVMCRNAQTGSHVGYNSRTGEQSIIDQPEIFAPVSQSYEFERESLYGGWVRGYYQGIVMNKHAADEAYGEQWSKKLKSLCDFFDTPLINDDLVMGDIASMYPVAVTYNMPIGMGEFITSESIKQGLIDQLLAEGNPMKIPLFIARVRMKPPSNPYFFESTLPQRDGDGALCWTYSTEYGNMYRHYNSLDLWLACKATMMNGDPNTVWTILEVRELVYWEQGAQIYRNFMQACAQGKKDGAAQGNENMRNVFKIAMNSSIGKLAQRIAGQANIIGEKNLEAFLSQNEGEVEIVGYNPLSTKYGLRHEDSMEYVLKTYLTGQNKMPQCHGGFMYAATRHMRWEWAMAACPQRGPLTKTLHPDPWYGDTDSKIHSRHCFNNIPQYFLGTEVGVYDMDTGRSNQQIDMEKVSAGDRKVVFTGLLGPKTYVMASVNSKGEQYLKFRCKGQRQFNSASAPCEDHGRSACTVCICPCGNSVYECIRCIIPYLHDIIGDLAILGDVTWCHNESLRPIKELTELNSLHLRAFIFTLLTGIPAVTKNLLFDRTLTLPTSKSPEFQVTNKYIPRTLSRPLLQHYGDSPPARLVPRLADLYMSYWGMPGIAYPSGSYLDKHMR